MSASILIAGIGNIFQGDDAFGVAVVQRLLGVELPKNVRVLDIGIRSLDLAFALSDNYDITILVDATSRGCSPGTLYTIEIEPDEIPDACNEESLVNSHALDPVRVLSFARSVGAEFKKILLIGCEPLITDREDTGHIGLSDVVEAAVNPALETIRRLIDEFEAETLHKLEKEEVYSHESR
jgi:hydrogenase maturation protease